MSTRCTVDLAQICKHACSWENMECIKTCGNKRVQAQSQQSASRYEFIRAPYTHTHKKIASPPSLRVFTTDGKANHSGISSPDRRRLRNSVPESFAILSPFSFATLSDMYPRAFPFSSPTYTMLG